MRERPILFSAPMVRAILAGAKTQTRRVVKGAPDDWVPMQPQTYWPTVIRRGVEEPGAQTFGAGNEDGQDWIDCPYGQPGDRLWVRETARCDYRGEHTPPGGPAACAIGVSYKAGGGKMQPYALGERDKFPWFPSRSSNRDLSPRWAPAIHMPRWASRINLEITSVRVERLQSISRGDAMAEGCPFPNMAAGRDPRDWYRELWTEINGPDSWVANPWVWVVEFKRVEQAHV